MTTQPEYRVKDGGRVLEFEDGTLLSVVTVADMLFVPPDEVSVSRPDPKPTLCRGPKSGKHRWLYAGV